MKMSILYTIMAIIYIGALIGGFLLGDFVFLFVLISLTVVSFIQNMSFTWVSRSRNSGDPNSHRYAAWASNGVWLLAQTFIAANVYTPITTMVQQDALNTDDILKIVVTFLVYAMATAEGSVFMMKIMLERIKVPPLLRFLVETGKKKVGER